MDPIKKLTELEPAKKGFSLWDEFKTFAFKGNVIDLAIGVIIGAAFAKLVDSLVKQIIMPLLGLVFPGESGYQSWKIEVGMKVIPYGQFLGELVNFLIVALALFLFLNKVLGWIMRKRKEEEAPTLTKDQELLTEIRDLLKKEQPPAAVP